MKEARALKKWTLKRNLRALSPIFQQLYKLKIYLSLRKMKNLMLPNKVMAQCHPLRVPMKRENKNKIRQINRVKKLRHKLNLIRNLLIMKTENINSIKSLPSFPKEFSISILTKMINRER